MSTDRTPARHTRRLLGPAAAGEHRGGAASGVRRGGLAARLRRRMLGRAGRDSGQSAIVMVVAITAIMALTGGILVQVTVSNDPMISAASVQRYAYRALESGLNAFQNAINANPYLAACNSASNSSNQCYDIKYQQWSEVAGTGAGNGVVPEYYLIDNPQQVSSTTSAVTDVEVQVVGAAGFPGHYVYQTTVADFVPENGFLDHVWWSNFESFNGSSATGQSGSATGCVYNWSSTTPGGVARPTINGSSPAYTIDGYQNVYGTSCGLVNFGPHDTILGPMYSNDTLWVDGGPNFGSYSPVQTADPNCLFADIYSPNDGGGANGDGWSSYGNPSNCSKVAAYDGVTYDATGSSYNHAVEPLPTSNAELAAVAKTGGCYYTGPTTITLSTTGTAPNETGEMTVSSPGTTSVKDTNSSSKTYGQQISSYGVTSYNNGTVQYGCPVNGTGPLPPNGVVYVDSGGTGAAGTNPFDGVLTTQTKCVQYQWQYSGGRWKQVCTKTQTYTGMVDAQTQATCPGCYYGQSQTSSPDTEADAFVQGTLAGHLTIASANDVIIDGNLTYGDCTMASAGTDASGSPLPATCEYNLSSQTNDTLGLIANNYVEVNHPVDSYGNVLPACGTSGAEPAPLCDPSSAVGNSSATGLTVDATVLALNDSFVVNNYTAGTTEGILHVYGSIQQDARGPVGLINSTGYNKYYLWDPRLALYSPPSYLTPGTGSWGLASSSVSTGSTCPPMTPVDSVPKPRSTSPLYPDFSAGTACTAIP